MVLKIESYFDIDPQLFGEKRNKSQLMKVNIANLNGIQPLDEYSEKKTERINALYKEYEKLGNAAQLSRDFPITCCAVPNLNIHDSMFISSLTEFIPETEYILAIIDGHHRVRNGPKHGITDFCCSIHTLSDALFSMKKLKKLNSYVSPEEYYKMLMHGMSTTIEAFEHRGYMHKIMPVKLV